MGGRKEGGLNELLHGVFLTWAVIVPSKRAQSSIYRLRYRSDPSSECRIQQWVGGWVGGLPER